METGTLREPVPSFWVPFCRSRILSSVWNNREIVLRSLAEIVPAHCSFGRDRTALQDRRPTFEPADRTLQWRLTQSDIPPGTQADGIDDDD
jgi:hypothetical protein